jgi:hypothetical protein
MYMIHLSLTLDVLVEGLPIKGKPLAKEILRAVSDPSVTGIQPRYAMPFVRSVLDHHIPYDDPDGFVKNVLDFLKTHEDEVDWGNRLNGDHEAESMVALVEKYVAMLNQNTF